jgi:hypothetical protein
LALCVPFCILASAITLTLLSICLSEPFHIDHPDQNPDPNPFFFLSVCFRICSIQAQT